MSAANPYTRWRQTSDGEWIEEWKRGRVIPTLVYDRALPNNRTADSGARTFHAKLKSIGHKNGGAKKAIEGLNYDARVGKHKNRLDELEKEGGRSRAEMAEIIRAAEAANTRKNGTFVLDGEIELPSASTAEQRERIAEGVAR